VIDTSPERDREERLNEVLLRFVEAREAGLELNRDELLAAHPDLREDLAAFFTNHDEVERLAAPLRQLGLALPGPGVAGRATAENPHSETAEGKAELGQLGDFRLLRELGRGGMGIVYEAEQLSLHRQVALKVLPFAAAIDPRQLQRFKNEATAAAHLRHEHIVPVYAVGCERGVHYYAMQYVEGQSLAALIAELRSSKAEAPRAHPAESTVAVARLSTEPRPGGVRVFDWIADLGRQAALALEHAHQTGIVHRDVKPGNLLLDPRGRLWVTDFGLAQMTGDTGLTMTGELLGTLRYASPEQALGGRGVVDHRSDVYSLGATLYELLTLRAPFDGRDRHELLRQIATDEPPAPRALNAAIPAALETIVLKALRKEPTDRYATAQEFADDLQRYLERRPVLARRPGVAERVRMWSRRHPAAPLGGVLALVLVTLGSVVTAALVGAEQRRAQEAYQRERQRAEEAEARLVLARRAVDELFRVSEEELADRPGTELLRKRLLRSALAYYQEFLHQRRDDPGARAELLDITRRVEQILADLAVLKAASHFYLLCQPAVLKALHLEPKQYPPLKKLTARVGKEWVESFSDIGLATPAERGSRALDQARTNEAELNKILSREQQTRLRQIGLQSEGASAFRDPEVAAQLALTPEQRERIRVIEDDAAFGWMRAMGRGPAPAGAGPQAKERSTNERLLAVLTEAQARKWRELTGKPVKGPLFPFGAPVPPQTPKKAPEAQKKAPQAGTPTAP
jgi:tRNA A-37 threonylcarbamoyl transferase component Bud32